MAFRSEYGQWQDELSGKRAKINWWLVAGACIFAAMIGFSHFIMGG